MEEMGKKTVSLDRLKPGEKGWIKELLLEERTGRKLEDMGFQRGRPVECAYQSPWGDPAACYGSVGCDPAGGSGEDSSRNRKRDGKWG